MKTKKNFLITLLCVIPFFMQAQSMNKNNPNNFPELIQPDIPGAPKLGRPQLIRGETYPVWGGGMGWAAPAFYDWDQDGKKDLLIGEFGSGMEKDGMAIGNFIRIYKNEGTTESPKFTDIYRYARGIQREVEHSTGTPLSIYTW